MTQLEDRVARHYTTGALMQRIEEALTAMGVDPARPGVDDLKPVDEFHTGGIEATRALLAQVPITPDKTVIDIGAGLGGTARYIAHDYGAKVIGVDLTPDFVAAGKDLTARVGLSDLVDLREGSATDMPVADGEADIAVMFHVGMNIEDKKALFREVARVLKPGGHFALFDVMLDEDAGDIVFPVPWSGITETSFVVRPHDYREAAAMAGLRHEDERERREFTLDYFSRVFRKIAAEGAPPLGIHLLMGADAEDKLKNYVANVEARRIAPVEMIYRRG